MTVENPKKLGFGLMRLPKHGLNIDVKQMSQMVDLFMEAGCTYFATGRFIEVMLIRSMEDELEFKETYQIESLETEY